MFTFRGCILIPYVVILYIERVVVMLGFVVMMLSLVAITFVVGIPLVRKLSQIK